MNIVLLGPPGAGTGTQAAKIGERCGVAHISTGDLFRAALKENSSLGRQVKDYLEAGRIVPDEVTSAVVARRIDRPDCAGGCMLDGYPRTLQQEADLDKLLAQRGRELDIVLYLDVTETTAIARLSGRRLCPSCGAGYHIKYLPPAEDNTCDACGAELVQRRDDRPGTIRDRLKIYAEQTSALVEAYEKRGILSRVDANGPPGEVTNAMIAALEALHRNAPAGRSET